jgi:hypothetical protein
VICPKCGYVLDPLEKECPRCVSFQCPSSSAPSPPPKPTMPMAPKNHLRNNSLAIVLIILGCILLAPLALCFGCGIIGSLGSPSRNESSSEVVVASGTAGGIANTYEQNEVLADARYKGKVITIGGYIDSVGTDIIDTPYVTLSASPDAFFPSVQCFFKDSSSLMTLRKGQYISITGRCEGKLFYVLMYDCRL